MEHAIPNNEAVPDTSKLPSKLHVRKLWFIGQQRIGVVVPLDEVKQNPIYSWEMERAYHRRGRKTIPRGWMNIALLAGAIILLLCAFLVSDPLTAQRMMQTVVGICAGWIVLYWVAFSTRLSRLYESGIIADLALANHPAINTLAAYWRAHRTWFGLAFAAVGILALILAFRSGITVAFSFGIALGINQLLMRSPKGTVYLNFKTLSFFAAARHPFGTASWVAIILLACAPLLIVTTFNSILMLFIIFFALIILSLFYYSKFNLRLRKIEELERLLEELEQSRPG